MSIRFRCAYCNQLMAIGTRKVGSVVHCTKCQNALVVPDPDKGARVVSARPGPSESNPQTQTGGVFEHNDFAVLFEQQVAPRPEALQPPMFSESSAPPPTQPQPAASFIEYDAIPVTTASRSAHGIHIPPGALAAVCAIVVVLVGLAFFLGFLIGRGAH